MKIITEASLRELFKNGNIPEEYFIEENDKLTPSAMDYLSVRHIKVIKKENKCEENNDGHLYGKPIKGGEWTTPENYEIFYTKEIVEKKPETMTHLYGNVLVYKDDKRMILRGRLDTLQSEIIDTQTLINQNNHKGTLINDLNEILNYVRKILASEVLNKAFDNNAKLLNLSEEEIRKISHNPGKYFGLKQMIMIDYKDGIAVSKLNLLRAKTREAELIAVSTYRKENTFERDDIVQALNRLSSIFHILMYREIAGGFSRMPNEKK